MWHTEAAPLLAVAVLHCLVGLPPWSKHTAAPGDAVPELPARRMRQAFHCLGSCATANVEKDEKLLKSLLLVESIGE